MEVVGVEEMEDVTVDVIDDVADAEADDVTVVETLVEIEVVAVLVCVLVCVVEGLVISQFQNVLSRSECTASLSDSISILHSSAPDSWISKPDSVYVNFPAVPGKATCRISLIK
jgi:hypothetical protein